MKRNYIKIEARDSEVANMAAELLEGFAVDLPIWENTRVVLMDEGIPAPSIKGLQAISGKVGGWLKILRVNRIINGRFAVGSVVEVDRGELLSVSNDVHVDLKVNIDAMFDFAEERFA